MAGFEVCTEDEGDGNMLRFYLSENGVVYYRREREKARNIVSVLRNMGTTEQMRSELERMGIPFQYPKPKELLSYLVRIGIDCEGLVLDFFAGSCTTAQAAIELARESSEPRRSYIMIQLPELLDESDSSQRPGFEFCERNGLAPNIAEIGKERIRRVAGKIEEEDPEYQGDLGFKVFKLDASNVIPWDADFDTLEESLFNAVENIKPDRSESDVLYEILLKYGLDLTLPIEERKIEGKAVFVIGAGALVICLDDAVTLKTVEGIAALKEELKPEIMRVVFKDAGFEDDVVKTNAVQILKQADIDDVKSL